MKEKGSLLIAVLPIILFILSIIVHALFTILIYDKIARNAIASQTTQNVSMISLLSLIPVAMLIGGVVTGINTMVKTDRKALPIIGIVLNGLAFLIIIGGALSIFLTMRPG